MNGIRIQKYRLKSGKTSYTLKWRDADSGKVKSKPVGTDSHVAENHGGNVLETRRSPNHKHFITRVSKTRRDSERVPSRTRKLNHAAPPPTRRAKDVKCSYGPFS